MKYLARRNMRFMVTMLIITIPSFLVSMDLTDQLNNKLDNHEFEITPPASILPLAILEVRSEKLSPLQALKLEHQCAFCTKKVLHT